MAKTIENKGFRMEVTPYEHEGNTYNRLSVSVGYRKGRGFYVTLHPVLTDGGEVYDFSRNPLSDTTWVNVLSAPRNNSAKLTAIYDNLRSGEQAIRKGFDGRDWEQLSATVKAIALGTTINDNQSTDKEATKTKESPVLKQYRDFKKKHPDTVMLFRQGDFYEAYEQDAETCGKVLGVTVTKQGTLTMTSFPHYALDTYLPKLQLWLGRRVAICDILETPKKKSTNNETNNKEEKTMATKKEIKAADLIGKTILAGKSAKYVVKAIDGDRLTTEFTIGNNEPMQCPVPWAQVQKMLEAGTWTVEDNSQSTVHSSQSENETPKPETSKPKTSKANDRQTTKRPTPQTTKYAYAPYTNKKGKKCAKIAGVTEEDEAYQHASELHASGSYERTKKGDKVFYIAFGPRYAEAAKQVCEAMNQGKSLAEMKAIIDKQTADNAQKREEWKAKRANGNAGYTAEQVAQMLNAVMSGGELPEDIKQAMAA